MEHVHAARGVMSEYVEYLHEVFEQFGPVRARRMFGGYGIYSGDVMFALVADDTLYLKADDENRADFEARGLPPFMYDKGGRLVKMSYYLAPDDIMEDRDEAVQWARRARDAALRLRRGKGISRSPSRQSPGSGSPRRPATSRRRPESPRR